MENEMLRTEDEMITTLHVNTCSVGRGYNHIISTHTETYLFPGCVCGVYFGSLRVISAQRCVCAFVITGKSKFHKVAEDSLSVSSWPLLTERSFKINNSIDSLVHRNSINDVTDEPVDDRVTTPNTTADYTFIAQ